MIWTLVTTLGDGSGSQTNGHPIATYYGSTFTFVGTTPTGEYVYSVCSLYAPSTDGTGNGWIKGDPTVVVPVFIPSANPVPTCPDTVPGNVEFCEEDPIGSGGITPYPATTVTGVNCAESEVEVANGIAVVTPPGTALNVRLCATEESIKLDAESVCLSNDGGITVVHGWEVFDVSTTPPTSKLYVDGAEVTGYLVVPCGKEEKYDYEESPICVNGENWTKIRVYDPVTSPPSLVSTLWFNEADAPVPAPADYVLGACVECFPTISDAFANDLSTLLPGNSFSITKPNCCAISVETTIGTFNLSTNETHYGTDTFSCPIEILSITVTSGSCSLDQIHVISNKIK